MGYSTEFKGSLQFTRELTASELAKLNTILGEDCRDHPEWGPNDLDYINLKLTEDFGGIEWDGAEKTYDMASLVNVVLVEMRKEVPDFGLKGMIFAQGDDAEDRWELHTKDYGGAVKILTPPAGTKIECPDCEHIFYLEK